MTTIWHLLPFFLHVVPAFSLEKVKTEKEKAKTNFVSQIKSFGGKFWKCRNDMQTKYCERGGGGAFRALVGKSKVLEQGLVHNKF